MIKSNPKNFRIAISGSHGIGKTTLIEGLKEKYYPDNIEIITGLTRAIIKRGFPLGKNATIDSYIHYIKDQIRAERLLEQSKKAFIISDRTILDAAAYAIINSSIPRPFIPDYLIEMLIELWLKESQYYNLLIVIPVEFPMKSDGIRDEDEQYRYAVNQQIENLLITHNMSYNKISGTIEERIETFAALLSDRSELQLTNKFKSKISPKVISKSELTKMQFETVQLEESGFADILSSPIIQRLSDISFLGLIDFVYDLKETSSRLEHTIGVAFLALQLSRKIKLNEFDTNLLVIAAFLHDVGHGPFSHNSEPFLLETKGLYHTGVLTKFIKSKANLIDLGLGDEVAASRSELLMNEIKNLINGYATGYINDLFQSAINCDKIEGNQRTGSALNLPGIDPISMIDNFSLENNVIYFNTKNLSLIDDFWEHERQLYWNLIYTTEVFSAEAMLTRALHIGFGDRVNEFLQMSEEEVQNVLMENEYSKVLLMRIKNRESLVPLSKMNPRLFEIYKDQFKSFRFDQFKRLQLEKEILKKLDLNSSIIISHFSRRKHFNGNTDSLKQTELFSPYANSIALSKIDDVLKRTKVSGDFFEIFLTV